MLSQNVITFCIHYNGLLGVKCLKVCTELEQCLKILKIPNFIFSTCIRRFINDEPVTYNKINFNICYYLTLDSHYVHEHLAHHVLCSSSTQFEPGVAVEYHQSTGCHKDECLNLASGWK